MTSENEIQRTLHYPHRAAQIDTSRVRNTTSGYSFLSYVLGSCLASFNHFYCQLRHEDSFRIKWKKHTLFCSVLENFKCAGKMLSKWIWWWCLHEQSFIWHPFPEQTQRASNDFVNGYLLCTQLGGPCFMFLMLFFFPIKSDATF